MGTTVEVSFKGLRREYFRWDAEAEPLRLRDPVIVPVERGEDFGRVSAVGDAAAKKCGGCSGCGTGADAPAAEAPPLQPVVRLATQEDIRQANELRRSEDDIRRVVAAKAREQSLAMRISDTEWQWDRKKLTIYFTAEQRVDFRNLVRDLASQYRTRIDLRQIGVRDEAARIGGIGRCGREFCCSTWLKDLSPVSLSLAKDQHLSLNPAQISGGCGRLLCCLRYEHEFYVASRKRFPKEGKMVRTALGAEKVVAVDIFRERVFLRGESGARTVALVDLRAEMEGAADAPLPPPPDPRPPAKSRGRAEVKPAPPPEPAPAPRTEAPAEGQPARKRRRRRRRRPGGDANPAPPGGAEA